jgi:hypothetical protein
MAGRRVRLSFGSQTGRTRSGTKGFSGKDKKQKKRKQEYHIHKRAHFQEEGGLDPEALRARTIIALDKLGHQVLSTEPGGYDLANWTRNFNALLDDFQERIGPDKTTGELRARREEAVKYLVAPPDSPEVAAEMEKLTQEEAATRDALDAERKRVAERVVSLTKEHDDCEKELKEARENLAEVKEAAESRGFFSRMLKTGPSLDQAEAKVKELEAKLSSLGEEIERSRKAKSGGSDGDPAYAEAEKKLDDLQRRLAELDAARQSAHQRTREREMATKTIAEAISSMRLDGPSSGEAATRVE